MTAKLPLFLLKQTKKIRKTSLTSILCFKIASPEKMFSLLGTEAAVREFENRTMPPLKNVIISDRIPKKYRNNYNTAEILMMNK